MIFSIDPLFGVPTSIVVGKYMNKIGRKKVLVFGLFLLSLSLFTIGFLSFSGFIATITLSIASRVLAGIGAGCTISAAPAILISECPDDIDKVIGYYEASSGLGYLVGPLVGSLFYFLDMIISFSAACGLFGIFAVVTYYLLKDTDSNDLEKNELNLTKFVRKPVFFN